jgi:RND family efflux transporter MFP subunit
VNKIIKIAAPVLVLVAGGGIFALLHAAKPEPEKKTDPPRPMSVFVETVEQTDVDLIVETSGEVRPRTEVDLIAQVAGRITSVSSEFIEGGIVTPGEPLITIEDTDYKLALSQAEVRVAESKVALQQALATADVARKQLRDAANASDLALKRPQVAEAEARIIAAKADLEQANLNLARTRISLPFQGRVISKDVDIGQYVSPGTRLGRAFSTDMVEVRIPLTDSQLASLGLPIGYVAQGEGLPVNLTARVAGREQHWVGNLVRLDATIDSETRLLYGMAQVRSPYNENVSNYGMPLAVGLFVNAEIVGRRVAGAYVIPREALRAGNKVYLVNEDGRLEIRDVTVTHSSDSEAIIATGISADEKVIVSSIRNPIEGMALEPMRYTFDKSAIADRRAPRSLGG